MWALELPVRPDLDERVIDPFDLPAIRERLTDLGLGNAPWAGTPWSLVRERQEMDDASGLDDVRQRHDVAGSIGVVEDVEHRGIDHGREGSSQVLQPKDVAHGELRRNASAFGLLTGALDGDG